MAVSPISKRTVSDTHKITSDWQRAELISNDINGNKSLSDPAYDVLLSSIAKKDQKTISEPDDFVPESTWSLLDMNTISDLERIEHIATGTEATLHSTGPIGSYIANIVGLLSVPWKCYKEKRKPTKDEGIKLAICAAAITFISVAIAFPPLAAGFFIAAAVATLIKCVQNIRVKKSEFQLLLQRADSIYNKIKQLRIDVSELDQVVSPTKEQVQQLKKMNAELTRYTDQYVLHGHHVHNLKAELQYPFKSLRNQINISMSAVALIGVVLFVFFPPIGLGLIFGSAFISLATIGVSAIAKRLSNQRASPLTTSKTNGKDDETTIEPKTKDLETALTAIQQSVNDHSDCSSTAKELLALKSADRLKRPVTKSIKDVSNAAHQVKSSQIKQDCTSIDHKASPMIAEDSNEDEGEGEKNHR